MKILIINGENNNENVDINIKEKSMVKDIKYQLDEVVNGKGNFVKEYLRLLHKNIILRDVYKLKYYKISENDEMWFGNIEKYVKEDDVILYVFVVRHRANAQKERICHVEYLILKSYDTISTIRSIIERIQSNVINIWNIDGKLMDNDQIISGIHTSENIRLVIRCDDGEGNKTDNTFEECCYLYDSDLMSRFMGMDQLRDGEEKYELKRSVLIDIINKIKPIVSIIGMVDSKFNENLADLPIPYLNSQFCMNVADRIIDICYFYSKPFMNQYEDNLVTTFEKYFPFAVRVALWEFSIKKQEDKTLTNKSVINILIDALDVFVNYLNDSSDDWRQWGRRWADRIFLRTFSDSDFDKVIDKVKVNKYHIKIKKKGEYKNNYIKFKPDTVIKAKEYVSKAFNLDMKHLYCIKPGGDNKLNDEDKFDDEFIIEIVLSMDDIETIKKLERGAFARIYLCRDKISNKQFVMKKPIRNERDLFRDINIYSKLNSSRHIMNYSGLFWDGESICIGMKYMSGGSFRSYLDKGKQLTEQEIVRISHEILTQINELHKLGIIHRDIKSDNIVLDEHNYAKLIDFGISKDKIELPSKDKINPYDPGTICYMAPELFKEESYSEKIDIWSYGMVMVEMVTGKRPFYFLESPSQIIPKMKDLTKYEFEPIFPISNDLNECINSCLNTNPNDRPTAEDLIKSQLFNSFKYFN